MFDTGGFSVSDLPAAKFDWIEYLPIINGEQLIMDFLLKFLSK